MKKKWKSEKWKKWNEKWKNEKERKKLWYALSIQKCTKKNENEEKQGSSRSQWKIETETETCLVCFGGDILWGSVELIHGLKKKKKGSARGIEPARDRWRCAPQLCG